MGDEKEFHPDPLQHRKASRLPYLYHPYEVAFNGLSGQGKTTLIQRLLRYFQGNLDLAYVKHRAHHFDLDIPGKDTDLAREAGSSLVGIADHKHAALLDWGPKFRLEGNLRWLEVDAVLIEGGKDEALAHFSFDPERARGECLGHIHSEKGDFDRDGIESIAERLLSYWQSISQQRPLSALVLCGGFSERMGQDKALLSYHGRTQIEHTMSLAEGFCSEVFVSVRPGQYADHATWRRIEDRFLGMGPIGGILTAMQAFPGRSWLVLPCDVPSLDSSHLEALLKQRMPMRAATVAMTREGIEPLIAVYEPKFYRLALAALGRGILSPKAMLDDLPIQRVEFDLDEGPFNLNTPSDRQVWFDRRSPVLD